jgi:hypothetical protein
MAGCSSNFGVARVVSVGKEAVLRKNVNQYSSFSSLSFRSVMLNEAAFPAICVNKCGGSHVSKQKKQTFLTMCLSQPQAESQPVVTTKELSEGGSDSVVGKEHKILNSESDSKSVGNDSNGVVFDSSGGNGSFGSGGAGDGSGGGGGGGGDDDEKEEGEFGPMLKLDEVLRETEARGVTLPFDMLEAAKTVGIPKLLLLRYLDLEVSFEMSMYVFFIGKCNSCAKEDDCYLRV